VEGQGSPENSQGTMQDISRVPPETKYFAETKFRRNEMAKRNGEIEIYFGEISPKRNDKIFISPKFRQNC
jgi:hypothetical protein